MNIKLIGAPMMSGTTQNESGLNNGFASIALGQITGQAVTAQFDIGGLEL